MKNLYLLITLFILAACGPSEKEAASEPTPPPVNVFDGNYEGNVSGEDLRVKIQKDLLTISGESEEQQINCILEDPTTTPTEFNCDKFLNGSVEIDADTDTLRILPDGERPGIFKRVENN